MIYFARAIEIENAPIKIGFSDDVVRRLDQLEWTYRTPLALLATMPGGREEEQAVHERFAHLRLGMTEQFRPAPELLAFIGRPLLASANSDAVEAMASHTKPLIVQLRGSEAWKLWVEKLARFDNRSISNLFERAIHRYAKEVGFPKEPPER